MTALLEGVAGLHVGADIGPAWLAGANGITVFTVHWRLLYCGGRPAHATKWGQDDAASFCRTAFMRGMAENISTHFTSPASGLVGALRTFPRHRAASPANEVPVLHANWRPCALHVSLTLFSVAVTREEAPLMIMHPAMSSLVHASGSPDWQRSRQIVSDPAALVPRRQS